ncbi:MAG: hypothetical protein ACQER7_14315 [Bacteroidota bacterium]
MKAIEFLTIKLEQLALKFEEIQIRYEYRENTQSHLVEVIPSAFFSNDEDYLREEAILEEKFENQFPNENIVFISEGSLTEIKEPNFIFGYNKLTYHWTQPTIEFYVTEGYNETVVKPCGEDNYAIAA